MGHSMTSMTVGSTRSPAAGCPRASVEARRRDRLVTRGGRRQPCSCPSGGLLTGASPVDRSRSGSKHHLLVDASGIPLAVALTGGNRHDVTQLIPLLDDLHARPVLVEVIAAVGQSTPLGPVPTVLAARFEAQFRPSQPHPTSTVRRLRHLISTAERCVAPLSRLPERLGGPDDAVVVERERRTHNQAGGAVALEERACCRPELQPNPYGPGLGDGAAARREV
jgi:hypothetical protein